MCEVLHDCHIGQAAAKTLPTVAIALLFTVLRRGGQNTRQDLVQCIYDASLQQDESDLRACTRGSGHGSKE